MGAAGPLLLDALRSNGFREGRQLEYKEALPGNGDDDKREFLADVSSFANAAGGDLIFGVRERRDGDGKPTGEIDGVVGLPGLNLDAERLRLDAIIRDAIAPRMPPVTFHEVRRGPDPPCLLLHIPRSWAGLHMVIYKNLSRFYSRTSAGKCALGMEQRVIGALARYQEFWKTVGLMAPVLVGLTLTGVKGWRILRGHYEMWDSDAAFDRDVVNPQEVVMSDLAAPADVVLRPLLDFVWCEGGWPGSPNYRDGRWVQPK